MTQEALTALNKSIQHWQQNVEKIKADQPIVVSAYACALCQEFLIDKMDVCRGCPVFEETNYIGCRNTPANEVACTLHNCKNEKLPYTTLINLCEAEVAFLQSLLPAA